MIKLSDCVADFITGQGIKHVFAVTGGASIHIIDSLAKNPKTDFICPHHEQAGAMAVDCEILCFSLQDAFLHVYGNHEDLLAAHGLSAEAVVSRLLA